MTENKESIYIETSVISAYFDFKKQDIERRRITRIFFREELAKYKAYISDVVLEELRNVPDKKQRQSFLKFIKNLPRLPLAEKTINLAESYIKKKIIPSAKLFDAYHLAIATISGIDILVSWNYNHIANKLTEESINTFNVKNNYPQISIEFPTKLLTPKT